MKTLINLESLKDYMQKENISKQELSKIIGVNYTTVYRVFKGTRKPGMKFVIGLMNSNIDSKYFLLSTRKLF